MTIRTLRLLPLALLVASIALPAWARDVDRPTLDIEAIYGRELNGPRVSAMRWKPDDSALSYLWDDREGRVELRLAAPGDDEPRVLVGAKELRRIAGLAQDDETELPPVDYLWSPRGDALLFSVSGKLKLHRPDDAETTTLAPDLDSLEYPAFSPDGDRVAFVHGNDLWIAPLDGGAAWQLTRGGSETLIHGGVSYVYIEEFEVKSGFAWSPDGRRIAFLEFDEQSVPLHPLVDELAVQAEVTYQRYPKAGDPNPRVRVGAVEVASGRVAWLDRNAEYVPRIRWADADTLAVQLMNRAQDELELVLADPVSGRSRSVLIERDEHWINVSEDLRFLDGGDFLWSSERSGYRHLYRYDREGRVVAQLTGGAWEVKRIEAVDGEAGRVYFSSNEANPIGRDLYRVALDGGPRERITPGSGTHVVILNDGATAFADTHSSTSRPPRTEVRAVAGGPAVTIHATPDLSQLGLVEPRIVDLQAPDGGDLRIKLLVPDALPPGAKLPVLLYVYGGPRSPVVADSWRNATLLFHQLLVQRGFVVAYVDDRTSARLGHLHEVALSRNWGPHVVTDHRAAVEYLRGLPYVDPDRFAVWGWSGGGYTTCYHLTHTGLFKVGIAVAPVTDWKLYDSIYTERYMGLPDEEPEAYAATSVLEAAAELQGRLLVIHGSGDDNVHPQNTIQLLQALIDAGKPVDLMLYPNKRHGIRGTEARVHLFSKILAYLEQHL
jgi:dipeptidyl-peptidase-4